MVVSGAFALDAWAGGWLQPLNQPLVVNSGFLANNCGHPEYGSYISGYYHLGLDLNASAGTVVYSIGNGTVYAVQTGWPGTAVFVKHTAADGTDFVAVYGHVDSTLSVTNDVAAGQQIGTVYNQGGNSHLHFGTRATVSAAAGNGQMPCGSWPDTNGYADPLVFLPAHPASIAPPTPSTEGDSDMTDLIYWANPDLGPRFDSGGVVVETNTLWYQQCPGAPLFALTGNQPVAPAHPTTIEKDAFYETRATLLGKRYAASAAKIGALIQYRGIATSVTL